MRISDWSSDVCSSDLLAFARRQPLHPTYTAVNARIDECRALLRRTLGAEVEIERTLSEDIWPVVVDGSQLENALLNLAINARSEEHTSELQSLMRISYAVFCLKKKKITNILDIKLKHKNSV